MRIGLVTNHLADGGAERQALLWTIALTQLGHEVEILVMRAIPGTTDYDLVDDIPVRSLSPRDGPLGLVEIRREMSRAARSGWDAMIAFQPYSALASALARPPIPWLAVTGDDPRYWSHTSNVPDALYRWALRRAPIACAPTRGIADCHLGLGVEPRHGWAVVPNIADDAAFARVGGHARPGEGILFVGRLVELKNPELAIEAATLAGARLTMLGAGPRREELDAYVAERGLAGQVDLAGFREPWHDYATHRVLLVTSDYESFGNVIVESLAAGTPVVSVDCDFGPREILAGARYSALTGYDPEEIATALRTVLERPYEAAEEQECREIASRYSLNRVREEIGALLDRTIEVTR
jgi:glycosyltransferase involved in cell wall biosynthesis